MAFDVRFELGIVGAVLVLGAVTWGCPGDTPSGVGYDSGGMADGGEPDGAGASPPSAEPDSYAVDQNSADNVLDVLANDSFGDDGPSDEAISIVTDPSNGTVEVDDNGTAADPTDDTVLYTPDADYTGSDSFEYEIVGADGETDVAAVDLNVVEVEDEPAAGDDTESVNENSESNFFPVVENDVFGTDGPSESTIEMTEPPSNGAAEVDDNETPSDPTDDRIVYTPDKHYFGTDSLTYEITDADGDTDTATVEVTVVEIPDVPTAVDDSETVNEDSSDNRFDVLANDEFGEDGGSNSAIEIVAEPDHGTANVNDGGTTMDPTDDAISYTPDANYNGADSLLYRIEDGSGDTDTATVEITVSPVNDLPTAKDDVETVFENSSDNTFDVLANDDFGGDGPADSAIQIVTEPTEGTAEVDDNSSVEDPTDDTIEYEPSSDFLGDDSLEYRIEDGNGDTDTASVAISVERADTDSPTASNDSETVLRNSTDNVVDVLANDDFGEDGASNSAIEVVDEPSNGSVSVDVDGSQSDPTDDTILYTPATDFYGTDNFEYRIEDIDGDTDTATVEMTVELPTCNVDFEDCPSAWSDCGVSISGDGACRSPGEASCTTSGSQGYELQAGESVTFTMNRPVTAAEFFFAHDDPDFVGEVEARGSGGQVLVNAGSNGDCTDQRPTKRTVTATGDRRITSITFEGDTEGSGSVWIDDLKLNP